MNNNHISAEQTVPALAHLAWCALVALRLAQHDGQALSPLMTHTFLMRWLAVAQKQRRFPREVAPDVDHLLRLGRLKGLSAGLYLRLEYLWRSCSSPETQQSELFRLAYAIEAIKAQGWINAVVEDHEWNVPALLNEYNDVSALLVKKSNLAQHFTEDGELAGSIEFVVNGPLQVILDAFSAQDLHYVVSESQDAWKTVMLKAHLP